MTLDVFLQQNNITLSEPVLTLCVQALEKMHTSIDSYHNDEHIFRMIDDLNILLKEEADLKAKINSDILMLALCWHDVWKSKRIPHNKWHFFHDQWWDGMGSLRMLKKAVNDKNIDKNLVEKANYAIRKHSYFQIFPLRTLEAKILRDIDSLDIWSLERVEPMRQEYLYPQPNPQMIKFWLFILNHFMVKESVSEYYFSWTKSEAMRRKKIFIDEVTRVLEEENLL